MRLLFDQNLSPRLARTLADLFPGSVHVRDEGLARGTDEAVWEFARSNELVIVSKDADFWVRCLLSGAPPKVIWIRLGNCTTNEIEALLRTHLEEIEAFGQDEGASFLALG